MARQRGWVGGQWGPFFFGKNSLPGSGHCRQWWVQGGGRPVVLVLPGGRITGIYAGLFFLVAISLGDLLRDSRQGRSKRAGSGRALRPEQRGQIANTGSQTNSTLLRTAGEGLQKIDQIGRSPIWCPRGRTRDPGEVDQGMAKGGGGGFGLVWGGDLSRTVQRGKTRGGGRRGAGGGKQEGGGKGRWRKKGGV